MTEKRFIPIFDGVDKRVVGAKDNGKIISFNDMFDLLNDLNYENEQLKSENQRLTDKLNNTALEFLNHDMVSMGKATEISEMCYYDFLKFRKENGNPMELQE